MIGSNRRPPAVKQNKYSPSEARPPELEPLVTEQPANVHSFTAATADGGEQPLSAYAGELLLIVNVASKCGLTPQFEGLQKLYETYSERGLQVLGTPSADFNDQEYDDASEIGAFCQRNYGVTFPMTEKMSVRADPSPLWSDLSRQPNSGPPVWNFGKYLVGADGQLLAYWKSQVKPEDPKVTQAIESALTS